MPFYPFASGSASPVNPDIAYEMDGWTSGTGLAVNVPANASANAKGAWTAVAVLAEDWAEFTLNIIQASSSSGRYALEVSFDSGGSPIALPEVYLGVLGLTGTSAVRVPINGTAGQTVYVRIQSSTAGASLNMTCTGVPADSPGAILGFTTATALTAFDTGATRASTAAVSMQGPGTPTWTQLIDPTAAEYEAFLVSIGNISTPTGALRVFRAMLGAGDAASEVPIGVVDGLVFTTANLVVCRPALLQVTVAAGERLAAWIQSDDDGAPDTFGFNVIGLRR